MANEKFSITKPEVRFWMYIIVTLIPIVVFLVSLQAKVNAVEDKGVRLREDYEKAIVRIDNNIEAIRKSQDANTINIATIKKDIEFIKERID